MKIELPEGPWSDEPDELTWVSECGLNCQIRRGPSGHLCGYVALPKGSPHYQVEYDSIKVNDEYVEVHGGLTYSSIANEHIGTGDDWMVGFDCAHLGDLAPMHISEFNDGDSVYRDMDYVKRECERLADQLDDKD